MKKVTIGYIFDTLKPDKEEDLFIKLAKKKGINLVMFNVRDEISEEEIEEKAKECDIIFNNTAGYMGLEMLKTFEELGKKTVDSSNVYYYSEDKWMFYLKCKKDKIPTPETILLSNNARSIKKELKEFNQWPVILKRIEGEQGEFVQKEGKWVVLEVNAEPSFEFFEDEHQKIINEVLDFIIKEVKK